MKPPGRKTPRFMAKVMSNKQQLKKMVELLGKNPAIANGVCSKVASQKVFKQFTPQLNQLGPPEREWFTWMRVWADLKCKIKKKKTQKTFCQPGEYFNPRCHYNEMEAAVIRLLYTDNETNIGVATAVKPICENLNMDISSSDDDDELDIIPTEEDMMKNISFEPLGNLDPKDHDDLIVKNEPLSPRSDYEDLIAVQEKNPPPASKPHPSSSRHLHVKEYHSLKKSLQSLKNGYQKITEGQIAVETNFFKTMIECMTDIRRSMDNIQDYMKTNVDENAELIEFKREKLKAFTKEILDEKSERQSELQLDSQLLAIEKKKLSDLRNKM